MAIYELSIKGTFGQATDALALVGKHGHVNFTISLDESIWHPKGWCGTSSNSFNTYTVNFQAEQRYTLTASGKKKHVLKLLGSLSKKSYFDEIDVVFKSQGDDVSNSWTWQGGTVSIPSAKDYTITGGGGCAGKDIGQPYS